MSFARGRHVWMLLAMAAVAVGLVALLVPRGTPAPPDALIYLGRATALVAEWSMFLTILSAADVGGVSRLFGRSFRTVHYAVAITGLVAMAIHPVVVAVRLGTGEVFLPVVSSWGGFWENGGRVALYLFVLVAALPVLRRRPGRLGMLGRRWRAVHLLAYPALLLAAVHGTAIGRTHHLLGLRLASGAMALAALGVLLRRRMKRG
jgi:hypothetical protein